MQQFSNLSSRRGIRQRAGGKSGPVQRIRPWDEARRGYVCVNCPDGHGTDSHPEYPIKVTQLSEARANRPHRLACLVPSCPCREWQGISPRKRVYEAKPPKALEEVLTDWESMRGELGFDPREDID